MINEWMYSGLIEQGYHVVPRVFVYGLPACMILAGLVRMERVKELETTDLSANSEPVSAKNDRRTAFNKTIGMRAPTRFSALTGGASVWPS